MHYQVEISQFVGPMDLLLHLIKQSNIDIYDIEIDVITKQYLDYIKAMEEINLNIASEYLVMATELIEIKSSMLLPKGELNDDEFEPDLKEDLINRLIEYKKYKELASNFKELEANRQEFFTKLPTDFSEYSNSDTNILDEDIKLTDFFNDSIFDDIYVDDNSERDSQKRKNTAK